MFKFRRRTLWIIIYLLIPIIFLLHRAGENATPAIEAAIPGYWSLDDIQFEQQDNLWLVNLPDASELRITVILSSAPAESLGSVLSNVVTQQMQGGRWLVSLTNPAQNEAIFSTDDFLQAWLPEADHRQWVLSGPIDDEITAWVRSLDQGLMGEARTLTVQREPAVSRLTSPPMGSQEQLAFLIWVGVLQQRLGGYSPDVRWDHRGKNSEVLFNQSLGGALFEPVSEAELRPVLNAYQESAQVRLRSAEQIHRYLVTIAVYGLQESFMLDQPERLAAIDLEQVNEQRARSRSERGQ